MPPVAPAPVSAPRNPVAQRLAQKIQQQRHKDNMKTLQSGLDGLGKAALDQAAATTLVTKLLAARDTAHALHLKLKGLPKHEALGTFYESLLPQVDNFVETYQGQYGVLDLAKSVKIDSNAEPVSYLQGVADAIHTGRGHCGTQDSHLQNLLDEMLALIYKTIYKLEQLDCKTAGDQYACLGRHAARLQAGMDKEAGFWDVVKSPFAFAGNVMGRAGKGIWSGLTAATNGIANLGGRVAQGAGHLFGADPKGAYMQGANAFTDATGKSFMAGVKDVGGALNPWESVDKSHVMDEANRQFDQSNAPQWMRTTTNIGNTTGRIAAELAATGGAGMLAGSLAKGGTIAANAGKGLSALDTGYRLNNAIQGVEAAQDQPWYMAAPMVALGAATAAKPIKQIGSKFTGMLPGSAGAQAATGAAGAAGAAGRATPPPLPPRTGSVATPTPPAVTPGSNLASGSGFRQARGQMDVLHVDAAGNPTIRPNQPAMAPGTAQSMQRLPAAGPGSVPGQRGAGGFFDPNTNQAVTYTSSPGGVARDPAKIAATARHELTHGLIHNMPDTDPNKPWLWRQASQLTQAPRGTFKYGLGTLADEYAAMTAGHRSAWGGLKQLYNSADFYANHYGKDSLAARLPWRAVQYAPHAAAGVGTAGVGAGLMMANAGAGQAGTQYAAAEPQNQAAPPQQVAGPHFQTFSAALPRLQPPHSPTLPDAPSHFQPMHFPTLPGAPSHFQPMPNTSTPGLPKLGGDMSYQLSPFARSFLTRLAKSGLGTEQIKQACDYAGQHYGEKVAAELEKVALNPINFMKFVQKGWQATAKGQQLAAKALPGAQTAMDLGSKAQKTWSYVVPKAQKAWDYAGRPLMHAGIGAMTGAEAAPEGYGGAGAIAGGLVGLAGGTKPGQAFLKANPALHASYRNSALGSMAGQAADTLGDRLGIDTGGAGARWGARAGLLSGAAEKFMPGAAKGVSSTFEDFTSGANPTSWLSNPKSVAGKVGRYAGIGGAGTWLAGNVMQNKLEAKMPEIMENQVRQMTGGKMGTQELGAMLQQASANPMSGMLGHLNNFADTILGAMGLPVQNMAPWQKAAILMGGVTAIGGALSGHNGVAGAGGLGALAGVAPLLLGGMGGGQAAPQAQSASTQATPHWWSRKPAAPTFDAHQPLGESLQRQVMA